MEHILWVVLVAFLGVSDQGVPSIKYEIHSVHVRQPDCYDAASDMIKAAQNNHRVDVQCVPFPHKTIW
jgi:hypothetical protein